MSRYRKVDIGIWADEKFRALSPEVQRFFLYLLTSPHSTAWGAYVVDDLYIMADLFPPFSGESSHSARAKIATLGRIDGWWKEVIRHGLASRDSKTRVVCFHNWFKYNLPVNEKSAMACINGILSLPKSSMLSAYCNSSEWVRMQLANRGLTEKLANWELTVRTELDTEQEQLQEQEQEQKPPYTPQGDNGYSLRFNEFWTAYPKKIGKGAAEKSWKQYKPSDDLLRIILEAIEKQQCSKQWQKDGGQWIPNPATWLNQKRWEDDLEASESERRYKY